MAKLILEIVTPEAKTFSGEVDMVVLPGVEGELGILPMHVPLMTQLLPGEVRILQGGKETDLVVGTGQEVAVDDNEIRLFARLE